MSQSFSFCFLDDEPHAPNDQGREGAGQRGSKFQTNHDSSLPYDVRDSTSTSEKRVPFAFRPTIDVESALTELTLKDLPVEYVSLQESTVEPMLRIQLTQDGFGNQLTPNIDGGNAIQLPSNNVDLIPGVYEGGATVWECSVDLLQYMISNKDEMLLKKHVLELGCGHALPSCWWLRERLLSIPLSGGEGQDKADFSILFCDFNDFVIDNIVLSNISINSGRSPSEVVKHVALGAGDWMDMSHQLLSQDVTNDESLKQAQRTPPDGRFDLILAAETTYTEKAARETAELMRRHLVVDSGIGLVATKRYYFGVGGGSHAFRKYATEAAASDHPSNTTPPVDLVVTTLQVYDSGAGNIRELLKVQCISRSDRR